MKGAEAAGTFPAVMGWKEAWPQSTMKEAGKAEGDGRQAGGSSHQRQMSPCILILLIYGEKCLAFSLFSIISIDLPFLCLLLS